MCVIFLSTLAAAFPCMCWLSSSSFGLKSFTILLLLFYSEANTNNPTRTEEREEVEVEEEEDGGGGCCCCPPIPMHSFRLENLWRRFSYDVIIIISFSRARVCVP